MANEIFLNNNQKFHVFSKSPITPTQGLSQVVNKSGHTTTTADVWANDIPWFFKADNKDIALSTGVDAKLNDMVLIGSAVYKRNKTEKFEGATFDDLWDSYALENGTQIYNSDEVHVLTYHKNVPISFLTAGANTNNAGQASNYAGRIFIGGKVVEQFVVSTDKLSGGIPSTGYGVAVYKSGEPLSEGELESNFLANSYAGIIQFNKKVGPSTAFTADVFEYKGAKLDAEVARIAAAVFGENGGDDVDTSLTQKVAQNTAAIATLNGDANTSGSVAKAVSEAVAAAEGRVNTTTNALAGRIAQLEGIQHFSVEIVPEGQTIENVTPLVENTIYLVKDADAAEGTYIEYIAYKPAGSTTVVTEKIGSTALDLSGYTTDDEHTALANRVSALDAATTGRVAVLEGKVSTLEGTTIPAIQKSVTDGVSEAKTYAEGQASAAQTAATNAASQALATARGEITTEIATAKSGAEQTAATALSAAVEQIGKDIEAAKNEAISSAEVTITAGTGIVVDGAGKGTTFEISVSDAVATAASVTALSEVVASNKTDIEGVSGRVTTLESQVSALTSGDTSVDTKIATAVEELEGEISGAVESLEGQISQAQTTLQGEIDDVAQDLDLVKTDIATGATAQAIAKAQSDATQALTDAAAVSTALTTAKSQSLAKTGTLTGMFSVATAGSVGEGITSITITDTGLSTAIATAKSGAEQTAATALATARGEITTEISTAVSGLESKLTTGEGSLGDKITALETATTTTLPDAIEQALEDAKAYSDSLHTTSLDYVVLGDSESLPTASADTLGKIYLVASQNAPSTDGSALSGSYVEYMTRKVSETQYTWEKIGTTSADLTAYAKTSEVTAAVEEVQGEVDALEEVVATKANASEVISSISDGKGTTVTGAVTVKDGRANATWNDLWGTAATMSEEGVLTISHDWITNPKMFECWNKDITKVEDNKAYIGNTIFANIQTERIKDGSYMFQYSDITSFDGDLSSLVTGKCMFQKIDTQNNFTSFDGDLSSLVDGTSMFSSTQLTSFDGDLSSLVKGASMFGSTQLTSFDSDLSSLVDGSSMFNYTTLTSFDSDLSSLVDGYNMFYGTQLTSFNGDLSSLVDGSSMFSSTQLTSFNGDLSSLVRGYMMFNGTQLTSFNGDLSSLANGDTMFSGTNLDMESLETICDTLPKKSDLKTWNNTTKTYEEWDGRSDFTYPITKFDNNCKKVQSTGSVPNIHVATITITYSNVPTDENTISAITALFEETANTKGWTIITNNQLGGKYTPTVAMTDGTVQRYIYAIKYEADEKTAKYVDANGKYWTVDTAEAIIGPNVKYWSLFATVEDAITEWGLTPYTQA